MRAGFQPRSPWHCEHSPRNDPCGFFTGAAAVSARSAAAPARPAHRSAAARKAARPKAGSTARSAWSQENVDRSRCMADLATGGHSLVGDDALSGAVLLGLVAARARDVGVRPAELERRVPVMVEARRRPERLEVVARLARARSLPPAELGSVRVVVAVGAGAFLDLGQERRGARGGAEQGRAVPVSAKLPVALGARRRAVRPLQREARARVALEVVGGGAERVPPMA